MGKSVEIPEMLHDLLAGRAAAEGLSFSEYVIRHLELHAHAGRTRSEVMDRIRSRQPVDLGICAADLIREGREERDRQLTERWSSSTRRH